jgi:hypothetical protein
VRQPGRLAGWQAGRDAGSLMMTVRRGKEGKRKGKERGKEWKRKGNRRAKEEERNEKGRDVYECV